jgi:VanZ family protein
MRALALGLGWLMIAAIVWLSIAPSPPKLDVEFGDKLGHFAAYGGLMLWFCQLYAARTTRLGCAAAFIAMGIGLEFAQGATGYRSFEVMDMAANTLGVLLGWGAALVFPGVLPGEK